MIPKKCEAVGKRIRVARKAKKMSLEKFGKKIGVSIVTAHRYETGERQPKYNRLFEIAEILDVSMSYLFDYPEKKTLDVTGLTDLEVQVLRDLVSMVRERKVEGNGVAEQTEQENVHPLEEQTKKEKE